MSQGRMASIPKADGSARMIVAPSLDDRVLMRGALDKEGPGLWSMLHPAVLGGRPGINVAGVARDIEQAVEKGYALAFRSDIEKAFDSTPSLVALDALEELMPDTLTHRLFEDYCAAQTSTGIPTGAPLSPMMMAAVINKYVMPRFAGLDVIVFVWVDDILILARDVSTRAAARDALIAGLKDISPALQLHPYGAGKTKDVDLSTPGVVAVNLNAADFAETEGDVDGRSSAELS